MLVHLLNNVALFPAYSISTRERRRIQWGDHKVRRSPLLKRMLRISYCWSELLCDARTWLWRGEKFPITVFCLQRGLNWIYAQCWNLGLQIWILPKGDLTHLCHSRVISSHKTCFAVILCLKHKYKIFSEYFDGTCSTLQKNPTWFVRVPIIPLIPCERDLFTFVRQQKAEMRHCYHLWAEGLRSDSCCSQTESERKKMCERKRMRYCKGETGWHQIPSSEP